jgi:uncharacterized protein (TIGR02996 family)
MTSFLAYIPCPYSSEAIRIVESIFNNPEDSLSWLVYGDWLDENGLSDEAQVMREIGVAIGGHGY